MTKYHIDLNDAHGVVIGDNTLVEQHFYTTPPPSVSASRAELLNTFRRTGAELRTWTNEIAGIHVDRAEVAQIVEWVQNTDSQNRLGMLLDQPGGGKTVVMRKVLERLEALGVPILTVKGDTLSGINTRNDLADRLGLPTLMEECVRSLATDSLCVVLLDQLDALSLTLTRDQAALDVILGSLAHLIDMDNVRIIASCRTFDLRNDPRLSTIKVDRKFELQPLDEAQVNQVLQAIHIEPAHLLPAHRTLLRVPLHLSIYAQIVATDTTGNLPESFRTLQELYDALWRKRVEVVPPHIPTPTARIAAIYELVKAMQERQLLTAHVGVLDEHIEVANYLEREGFIRRERGHWIFSHQTLFDYCYARRFVAQGRSLSQEILASPQGLFERSQMVQVLAYLRGVDEDAYYRELTQLLFADKLRVHLRLLSIGWFGSLPNPNANELQIARRLMQDADGQVRFLQAAGGNDAWFDLINTGILPSLLHVTDEKLDRIVVPYISTVIQRRTDAVLNRLRPYLGRSEIWDTRIGFCLAHLQDWQSDLAIEMLCDLLGRGGAAGRVENCLLALAQSNPAASCRALRAYLDYQFDALWAQTDSKPENRWSWDQKLLGEFAVSEAIKTVSLSYPEKLIEYLLPWFVRATLALMEPNLSNDDYPSDPIFAFGWYGEHISDGAQFAWIIANALGHLASTEPEQFRLLATELSTVESLAIHRVLSEAYLAAPQEFADDIFNYLISDPRRLNIGEPLENSHYDTCRLLGATFQHLEMQQRSLLEQLILNLEPQWERRSTSHRGLTQLRFLRSIPPHLMSKAATRRLMELERKFPDFQSRPPQGVTGGSVGSPIDESAQDRMSDEAWLGAMRKYDDSTAWGVPREDLLEGGIVELSRAFAEQAKANPTRFYQLAQHFNETIPRHYAAAAITGLADSDAPSEWVFDLARQFGPHFDGEFRRTLCWALQKRAKDGVPDDLLDLMTEWALHDPNPEEEVWQAVTSSGDRYYRGDPHSYGINSNRGVAIITACRCSILRKPPLIEQAFRLLDQAADDPSTAVRTCVIESLGSLLKEDDDRTLTIFERTMHSHPVLLQSPLVHRFLYWTYARCFPRIRPFLKSLLANAEEETRQAGARLVCLSAFQYSEANTLVHHPA